MTSPKAVSILVLTALSLSLTSCGNTSLLTPQSLGQAVFTSDQFQLVPGQSWDMQAENGDLTHFETLAIQSAGCEPGELLDLHTTKTLPQDYWQAGLAGAEIHWIMRRDPSGNWNAVASLINWDSSVVNAGIPHTVDYLLESTDSYLVVPAVAYSNPQSRTGYAQ